MNLQSIIRVHVITFNKMRISVLTCLQSMRMAEGTGIMQQGDEGRKRQK